MSCNERLNTVIRPVSNCSPSRLMPVYINPTIDACFDADRLDLGRVGITPDPNRMATEKGKEMAKNL